jgi:hypothetical protein
MDDIAQVLILKPIMNYMAFLIHNNFILKIAKNISQEKNRNLYLYVVLIVCRF